MQDHDRPAFPFSVQLIGDGPAQGQTGIHIRHHADIVAQCGKEGLFSSDPIGQASGSRSDGCARRLSGR